MRFNVSLLLAAAASLPSPASGDGPSHPLVSLAAASKRAFLAKAPAAADGPAAATATSLADAAAAAASAEDLAALIPPHGGAFPESQPLSQEPQLDLVADAPLVSDIEMLSSMLAEVVARESPDVFRYYARFRELGMDRAADPNDATCFEEMKKLASDISPSDAFGVMKTFSIALNLVNAAEVHHRMRLVREGERGEADGRVGPLPMVEDGIRGTMDILLEEDGVSKDEVFERLITQKCEIVLTAHPTEVNRKTMIRKCEWRRFAGDAAVWCAPPASRIASHSLFFFVGLFLFASIDLSDRIISELLAHLERPDLHPFERAETLGKLRGIIAAIWGSDEIR